MINLPLNLGQMSKVLAEVQAVVSTQPSKAETESTLAYNGFETVASLVELGGSLVGLGDTASTAVSVFETASDVVSTAASVAETASDVVEAVSFAADVASVGASLIIGC